MANVNATGYAIRVGTVVLSVLMIWFMLGRARLYPSWTVLLIAGVCAVGAVSMYRAISG